MSHSFGPWATGMYSGCDPQLSTFWRRRLTGLPAASRTSPALTGRAALLLCVTAIALGGVPTIQGWAASARAAKEAATPTAAGGGAAANTPQPLHKAKSYKCSAIWEIRRWEDDDTCRVEETGYWLACGSERHENTFKGANKPLLRTTEIRQAGRPGILIDDDDKSYNRYPAQHNNFPSPIDDPENTAILCARAERQRGVKTIDGRQARGYVVDAKKIDPDLPVTSGFEELWIDVETNLPILVHGKWMREDMTWDRVAHYQWNIDLDPKLFALTPPAGYKDITSQMTPELPLAEQTRRIAEAFRVYAQASAGHYPQTRYISSSVQVELSAKLGLHDWPPTREQFRTGPFAIGHAGFREVQHIEAYRPDVIYNGKTVGPRDKDKVLLRWKLDDGCYAVIYGDLHSETLSARRLQTVEMR